MCHQISVHFDIEERIFCDHCNEYFANRFDMDKHRKTAHPEKPRYTPMKNKQCEECGLCFTDKAKLDLHIMDQ
jgi:hypothetical protein